MRKLIFSASIAALTVVSCNNNQSAKPDILAANIDTTIRPQDDFFDYANGAWLKKNDIPGDETEWGIGNLVDSELYERKRKINEDAVKNPQGDIAKKIAAFWKTGMDTTSLETQTVSVLQPQLDLIDSVKDVKTLLAVSAALDKIGVGSLFGSYVGQDDKNSSAEAFQLYQGGLGLPNRDYYFNTDARTTKIRNAYIPHIQKILMITGEDSTTAKSSAQQIFNLEKTLAASCRKLADLRDPYKNYNKFSVSGFAKQTSNIDWQSWLQNIGINHLDSLIVGQPEFFKALNKELAVAPIKVWKEYLKYHLLSSLGTFVNTKFDEENFDFGGKIMSGVTVQRPRWKRVLDWEEGSVGEALGQLFVKKYFDSTAKKRYSDLVEDIRAALKERIEKLDWMSDSTKQKALYKLSKMNKKVGYPDKWKDFSAMEIKDQPFVKNIIAANLWWHNYEIEKLGKPVDREEWDMTPQTYNAYYNPSNNEIVLPAGMFTVPGMRDNELDDAFVYGYAGASTIGHEMTHGFDDQGRLYDAEGNLTNWWSKEDEEQFKKRAAVIINEFNGFNPVDTSHINGAATTGENIADLGGVLLGWDAFTKTQAYKDNKTIAGLTPAQRFFLGYAYSWMYKERPERLARQLMTDVHSPAKYRVIGPFENVDAFYKTYNIKPGDKMYIADSLRVRIW
ncbi:metalloendopeptidase [Arachidicoccus ginsenosidimutans]|uniref:M13 family metallopeptidase n=1 Tax=Arachidicoccus sp. BS20 TaxID=1850526 RepID=UPI0007F0BA8F|nr:M13 family metallopeptidase [Arachidicoccus sp. BS20]ANI88307.1 metalloendopeptidase [Arachidicoccus sp. BS20]